MIEEHGQVVRVEDAAAWVETQRQSTCGQCQVESTCGHGLMSRLLPGRGSMVIRVPCHDPLNIGDRVTIAVPEQALLSASFLVYLVPLVLLLLGATLGTMATLAEPMVIVLAGFGFVLGCLAVRWLTHHGLASRYEPVLVQRHIPLTTIEK